MSLKDVHDNLSYERGFIIHSRSPHNQMLNFHHSYGGFYNFWVKRFIYQFWYKKVIRPLWVPAVFWFFFGWATMRGYDNAVYDYFYFFDAKGKGHH